MKYIRTKDGRIAEVKENMIVRVCDDATRLVYKNRQSSCVLAGDDDIIKQADTIEGLCDEFVEVSKKGYFKPFLAENRFELFNDYTKQQIYNSSILYGAIWTDKGLIYVAKMNEKRELELL